MDDLKTLVMRAQASDLEDRKQAFNELTLRYQPLAYKVALQMLRDAHMAEDAVQDAFIAAYLRIDQLRDPLAFAGWLRRIVYTHCDRMIRGKQPHLEPLETRYDIATENPGPESVVETQEIQSQVQQAINALPDHERDVTEGYYLQGESQQELAERLQVPVTTVKKRLQYARQHLRVLYDEVNAAMDQAIADMLKPAPKPQRQPAYLYARNREQSPPTTEE